MSDACKDATLMSLKDYIIQKMTGIDEAANVVAAEKKKDFSAFKVHSQKNNSDDIDNEENESNRIEQDISYMMNDFDMVYNESLEVPPPNNERVIKNQLEIDSTAMLQQQQQQQQRSNNCWNDQNYLAPARQQNTIQPNLNINQTILNANYANRNPIRYLNDYQIDVNWEADFDMPQPSASKLKLNNNIPDPFSGRHSFADVYNLNKTENRLSNEMVNEYKNFLITVREKMYGKNSEDNLKMEQFYSASSDAGSSLLDNFERRISQNQTDIGSSGLSELRRFPETSFVSSVTGNPCGSGIPRDNSYTSENPFGVGHSTGRNPIDASSSGGNEFGRNIKLSGNPCGYENPSGVGHSTGRNPIDASSSGGNEFGRNIKLSGNPSVIRNPCSSGIIRGNSHTSEDPIDVGSSTGRNPIDASSSGGNVFERNIKQSGGNKFVRIINVNAGASSGNTFVRIPKVTASGIDDLSFTPASTNKPMGSRFK